MQEHFRSYESSVPEEDPVVYKNFSTYMEEIMIPEEEQEAEHEPWQNAAWEAYRELILCKDKISDILDLYSIADQRRPFMIKEVDRWNIRLNDTRSTDTEGYNVYIHRGTIELKNYEHPVSGFDHIYSTVELSRYLAADEESFCHTMAEAGYREEEAFIYATEQMDMICTEIGRIWTELTQKLDALIQESEKDNMEQEEER